MSSISVVKSLVATDAKSSFLGGLVGDMVGGFVSVLVGGLEGGLVVGIMGRVHGM